MNVVLPDDAALGHGSLIVRRTGWTDVGAPVSIVPVAPGVFTLNEAGLVAASVVRSQAGREPSWEAVLEFDPDGSIVAKPIVFGGNDEQLSLVLYATGIRGRNPGRVVIVQIGDFGLAAEYAGPQQQYEGLDQLNIKLPTALAGKGSVTVSAEVDGLRSNIGSLTFR